LSAYAKKEESLAIRLNIAKNLCADRRRKIKSISSSTAISIAIEIILIAIERIRICKSKI